MNQCPPEEILQLEFCVGNGIEARPIKQNLRLQNLYSIGYLSTVSSKDGERRLTSPVPNWFRRPILLFTQM
jgi:hypothetical protein